MTVHADAAAPGADVASPTFPTVLTIIISYDTPDLTRRAYEGIAANEATHIAVLDHSSAEDRIFHSPHTIDLGRDVLTYGECLDIVLGEPQFRRYDFVGIFCNDVFDIPADLVSRLFSAVAMWPRPVGLVSPAIVRGGSPHPQMRRQGHGLRPVPFVETIAPYVHTSLFPVLERFAPTPSMGWGPDVAFSGIARALGYDVLVFDDVELGHVTNGGAFKELGMLDEHERVAPREANAWLERHNLWPVARWTAPGVVEHLAKLGG